MNSAVDQERLDLRRFGFAENLGRLGALPLYCWVLFSLWGGGIDLTRAESPSTIYSLQARALLHGHLSLRPGSIGIEGFIHGGQTFTYFGIFPSLLRTPLLFFAPAVPNDALTAPMLLGAWIATAIALGSLLRRLRRLLRGPMPVGRAEAIGIGLFTFSVLGGSVLLNLASNPATYSEDFAWSVALMLGFLAGLIAVIERATPLRIGITGAFVMAACLNRLTTGWAAAIGCLLAAGWMASSQRSTATRRQAASLAGMAGLGVLAGAVITFAKFGTPFGLPMADQVFTQINAHRQAFLAANGGRAFSPAFLPTTLNAYLNPTNLGLSRILPFWTLPTTPPRVIGGVTIDQSMLTASATASMPLLFLLSLLGSFTALRRNPPGGARLVRIPLIAAGLSCVGVLVWGFIATRYLADLLPFLVLAGGLGLFELFRRSDSWSRPRRIGSVAIVGLLALWSAAANIGIASSPTEHWSQTQLRNLVVAQRDHSLANLSSRVIHVTSRPVWSPLGTLYEVGNCRGLYLSNGTDFSSIPGEQLQHANLMPIEQGPGIATTLRLDLRQPPSRLGGDIPLLRWGGARLVLHPVSGSVVAFRLVGDGHPEIAWPGTTGGFTQLRAGQVTYLKVVADPLLGSLRAFWLGADPRGQGKQILARPVVAKGLAHALSGSPGLAVTDVSRPTTTPICRSLAH